MMTIDFKGHVELKIIFGRKGEMAGRRGGQNERLRGETAGDRALGTLLISYLCTDSKFSDEKTMTNFPRSPNR